MSLPAAEAEYFPRGVLTGLVACQLICQVGLFCRTRGEQLGLAQKATQLADGVYNDAAMRKSVTLIFYLLMIGAGSWAAYEWLVLDGRNLIFKAGGFLALFGAYLVWIDFLSPKRERF